jgi:signal peptidase II
MNKLTPYARFAYGLAAVVIVIDQLSKWWITGPLDLPMKQHLPVLPPLFNLSMVWNRGVSFGMLRADADIGRWGLALFSAAVAVGLAIWARKLDRKLPAVAIGLVVGGALGNLIDRVRLGAVVDFLDFSGLYFPWVFNIADSAITIGVVLLLLDSLTHNSPSEPKAPAE